MVIIPKGLLTKFHGNKPENQKAMVWDDDADAHLFEEKEVRFQENTLEHLCANLFLALEAVITKVEAEEHTRKFVTTARQQLKSLGVNVETGANECYATPSDGELIQLHNYYTIGV